MKKNNSCILHGIAVSVLTITTLLFGHIAAAGPIATLSGTNGVSWLSQIPDSGFLLTISYPDGSVARYEFAAGESLSVGSLPDGSYNYELTVIPNIPDWVRDKLTEARASGNDASVEAELRASGLIPKTRQVQSGGFTIQGGSLVSPDLAE